MTADLESHFTNLGVISFYCLYRVFFIIFCFSRKLLNQKKYSGCRSAATVESNNLLIVASVCLYSAQCYPHTHTPKQISLSFEFIIFIVLIEDD